MAHFNLTIEDLEQQTGLTRKYIDRCYARFGSLLAGYRKQAPDQNKWLYDGNAVAVFLQIRHFKEEQAMKLPEIRDRIAEDLGSRRSELGGGGEVEENTMETAPVNDPSVDTKTFITALKDAYELAVESERGKVLLLEESLQVRKQKEQEHEAMIARFVAANERRKQLLSQLESLAGRMFSSRKRRAIIREIRQIDSEAEIEPKRGV